MSRYSARFRLTEAEVVYYVEETLDFFSKGAHLCAQEIGDGNINYVFRVWDEETKASIIIKQADVLLRTSGRPLDVDRIRIEAEVLERQWQLFPGFSPKIYHYDPVMRTIAMEDLSDHQLMRTALLKLEVFPAFAEHISDFLVNTLLPTTDLIMDSGMKKELVKKYVNKDLCQISEDLVFTEPYNDYKGRNNVMPENMDFVKKEIYNDRALALEVGKLKHRFMNHAQALIHGDLHTGSILVKKDATKVMDPEFAFYGPIGYDLGNVIGNMFFSWANIHVTKDKTEVAEYLSWLADTIEGIVDLFKEKFVIFYQQMVTDVLFQTDSFMNWYLETVLADAAGSAGLEMIRRVVGDAKVIDITGIDDIGARIKAERILMTSAKRFIKERDGIKTGKDYTRIFRTACESLDEAFISDRD